MVGGGSGGRDEVVVELWRKRKQHIEQTRKDKCAQRKWHSNQACAIRRFLLSLYRLFSYSFLLFKFLLV